MFEQYRNRIKLSGNSIRESLKQQSVQISESLFSNSTSVRNVIVDGESYEAKLLTDSKTTVRGGNGNYLIQFRDDFYPDSGTYVQIPDKQGNFEIWLIMYESDDIRSPKHIIKKCNYLLKWKNSRGKIIERWAVFNDNNKLQDGERKTAWNKMALPYYSIPLVLPCDEETINVRIDKRFLIDSANVEGNPDAWIVTNRNVISKTFNNLEGVIELSVSHHQFNHTTDSKEFMIADYFKEYQTDTSVDESLPISCKISYRGTSDLKMSTPFKVYTAEFYQNGVLDETIPAEWEIIIAEESKDNFTYEIDGNQLKVKCKFDNTLIGSHIRLIAKHIDTGCSAELPVKVVSSI